MDFQTRQAEAKTNTGRLVALLACGVIAIIAIVSLLLIALFYYGSGEFQPLSAVAVAAPITTIGIVGTSLVKSSQIKGGGGSYVATSMGGRPVDFNTLDPAEKQLSNVVEEIAIASGMPVPAVFVLDEEPGINAFAAGWTADNAAIGVTRGALQHLNRRELQGVIAHEFAHIRNGDTRIKTRIIGWVFGIAVITVVGRILLHHLWWAPRRRDREDNSQMIMLAAGIGLVVIGSIGTLFARMVQASVSRQREYLADASAVQYTRDPSGIAQALMKIGGMGSENKIRAAHATEADHLFISSAFGSRSFASHPPLADRIARLVPDWDGEFPRPEVEIQVDRPARPGAGAGAGRGSGGRRTPPPPGTGTARGWGGALPGQVSVPGMPNMGGMGGLPGGVATGAILAGSSGFSSPTRDGSSGGTASPPPPPSFENGFAPPTFDGPTQAHIRHAQALLAQIPEPTQNYLHTRQGAVASVIGLLVSPEPVLRTKQLAVAGEAVGMEAGYLDAAGKVIGELHRSLQLPAIDIALHSIRETPYEYKLNLAQTIRDIESSNPEQDLFRWMLRRVMLRHLEDQHDDGSAVHDRRLDDLRAETITVYGVIAWFNSSGTAQTQASFEAALAAIGAPLGPVPPIEQLTFDRIDEALDTLSDLEPGSREAFVRGATASVLHDGKTTVEEAELIRVVADAVRLPVPPLLPA
jgi:Zn-dependent protease with chaperone function